MAIGEHEPIAIEPLRVCRVMSHQIGPENLGNIRHTHWCTWMTGLGLLHSVHRQCPDCVRGSFFSTHEIPARKIARILAYTR